MLDKKMVKSTPQPLGLVDHLVFHGKSPIKCLRKLETILHMTRQISSPSWQLQGDFKSSKMSI